MASDTGSFDTGLFDTGLLPPADETARCAPHAASIGLDPGGTALHVDELLVVDVPLPWPKPVWAKDGFTEIPELVMAAGEAGRRVRVLAAVPLDDGIARVVTHRIGADGRFDRTEHQLASADDVARLAADLLRDGLDARPDTVVDRTVRPELLLCTQGSHDICCGSLGTNLHNRLDDAELSVRRVSHTGGHRMAPTGVALPSGRMWGHLSLREAVAILHENTAPSSLADKCRGWLGAATGPAQVAERAVLAHLDTWEADRRPRRIEIMARGSADRSGGADDDASGNDTSTTVVVQNGDDEFTVTVAPGRAVPTIACNQPGGLPAKPGQEWRVVAIEPRRG